MAILHADFGCFSEAVAAMNETIATARENQDLSCLNFSLNWLNHLNRAYPKQMKSAGLSGILGSERDSLMFLKTKAKEMKMWSLLSSALLNEARLELQQVRKDSCLATFLVNPLQGGSTYRVFEHMHQSSHLIFTHCIWSNIGAQLLSQSSSFARLGTLYVCSNLLRLIHRRAKLDFSILLQFSFDML